MMGLRLYGKVLLVFLVFLAGVGVGAGVSDLPGLPGPVIEFVSNERINVYTIGPDNVADVVGYVVGEGVVEDSREGGVSNPTINIFMTKRVVRHLEESDEPLGVVKGALASGEMKIQGVGVKSGLKVSGFLEALKRLAPETGEEPPREASPVTTIRKPVADIASRNAEGAFVIDGEGGLKYSSIAFSIAKLTADDNVVIKEYSGLGFNEVPQGTKRLAFSGNEEPVGRFLDLQLPDGIDWVVITFTYTDEELYAKNIKEDDLKVKWYDENTGFWVTLDEPGHPDWYDGLEWDKEKNTIGVKVKHASVYGIGGSIGPAFVPEKVKVRPPPQPVAFEEQPEVQPVEVTVVSTESPNWPALITVGIVLLIVVLVVLLKLRGKGKKEEVVKATEEAEERAEEEPKAEENE